MYEGIGGGLKALPKISVWWIWRGIPLQFKIASCAIYASRCHSLTPPRNNRGIPLTTLNQWLQIPIRINLRTTTPGIPFQMIRNSPKPKKRLEKIEQIPPFQVSNLKAKKRKRIKFFTTSNVRLFQYGQL